MAEPAQILSISQLTRKIRMMLEIQIGEIWVEGEVSNLRQQSSGHQYFTLKDGSAQLSCVFFRGAASKSKIVLTDGMLLQAFGELSVYEAQGKYQLVVAKVQEKGEGALQARFEALKRRLHEEGLFDADRKKNIPKFPNTLALVTSPTGAAVRDMLQILARRAPWVQILVTPVRVQGRGAETEIAAAIDWLNQESGKGLPTIDTLVVGRGGGSIEDLWCFNEEIVARAIDASRIPVISAVGHEIDFTIADFAADLRAPTPSAAAELAVPDREDLQRRLRSHHDKLQGIVARKLDFLDRLIASRSQVSLLRGPEFALRESRQRLDSLAAELINQRDRHFEHRVRKLDHARYVLASARPDRILDHAQQRSLALRDRLHRALNHRQSQLDTRLAGLRGLLISLGPQSVLMRGYSITRTQDGRTIRSADDLPPGTLLNSQFAQGCVTSKVIH